MASPSFSSSKPRNYKFKVFSSFHGADVRRTFFSHLREQFLSKGITMFDDENIERGGDLSPSLKRGIRKSKISIVILSKRYASSSWCLDELVEIVKRKKAMKQIVMTVFYGVEPSDVRDQTGDFGIAFDETCATKTDKERHEWSKALTDVSNIAGEDFKNWDNEANMIKKIARDVSDALNATPSKDFEGMVGIAAHLKKIKSLLHLDHKDKAMIFGISGPAGIGKTTIARALETRLSNRFQHSCFMDLRGSDLTGLHDYGQQLHLQEQLLSKVFNQDGMRICHLGVVQERLCNLKVLIILDDVNDVKQLKVLAKETTWFGPGSRIIVTTENKDLLQQHGICDTYHVGFPSHQEALKIFCRCAFEQSYPPHGFKELAARITHLCGNLPLGLSVMGSSLFGKKQDEWDRVMQRLETNPGREIDDVLRVSYDRLHENDQMLFLHVAVFFNYKSCDLVEAMLDDDGKLDVKSWLKVLVTKSLIEINHYGQIVMHKLLQQVGRQAIGRQELWKRQILIDAHEICDVLEHAKGTRTLSGISFDIANIDEVSISKKAFKRMPNLRFLRVYKSRDDGNYRMHVPEEMEFPRRLKLLEWEAYPSKSLPPTFNPEYLVRLNMRGSKVEKLWEGIQPLKNLKYMDLTGSKNLKEVPDLSKATNLEVLGMSHCESLVEIPTSFKHLQNLYKLRMKNCKNLQVIPADMNLASLEWVDMGGCTRLRNIPVMSTNIKYSSYRKKLLPGREVPEELDNRAKGSSLTIVLDGNKCYNGFVFCLVISPNQNFVEYNGYSNIAWRRIVAEDDGYPVEGFVKVDNLKDFRSEHSYIFHYRFQKLYRPKVNREVIFEFTSEYQDFEINECAAKILTQEDSIEWRYEESGSNQASKDEIETEPSKRASEDDIEVEPSGADSTECDNPTIIDGEEDTDCWSWLFLCFASISPIFVRKETD